MYNIENNKIACFSDIHLGLGQDNDMWHNISLDFAKWASETLKTRGIKEILIPGDVFHNRSEISVKTLSISKQFFDYFNDFTIYVSTGNHDCFLKHNSEINSISILNNWQNIHVFDKSPVNLKYKNKNITMIPWGTTFDNIPNSDIIFGHFEISSFYMNSFKICENGMKSSDLFKKSPYIISGHFHKKDYRKYDNGEILYLGSPFQHNFGDCLDERGIYIFDINKNEFEFIKNDISPKHFKISIKKITNQTYTEQELKDITTNNIISLICDCKIDQEALLSIQCKINELQPLSIRIDYENNDTEIDLKNDAEYNSGSLLTDIETYIEGMDIDCKKEVAEYIKEVYNTLV